MYISWIDFRVIIQEAIISFRYWNNCYQNIKFELIFRVSKGIICLKKDFDNTKLISNITCSTLAYGMKNEIVNVKKFFLFSIFPDQQGIQ